MSPSEAILLSRGTQMAFHSFFHSFVWIAGKKVHINRVFWALLSPKFINLGLIKICWFNKMKKRNGPSGHSFSSSLCAGSQWCNVVKSALFLAEQQLFPRGIFSWYKHKSSLVLACRLEVAFNSRPINAFAFTLFFYLPSKHFEQSFFHTNHVEFSNL